MNSIMIKIIIIGLVFFTFAMKTESQTRWVKQYMEGKDAPGHHISTSYDMGIYSQAGYFHLINTPG